MQLTTRVLLVVLLIAGFSGCSHWVSEPSSSPTIVVSPNDSREYRYLTLPNQMTVVLVSDPAVDKAAASLDVEVGSAQDPASREGLAHFLEHMLFLGTEKYPQPDSYQAFISAHGGQHNAYTSFNNTNYFFDIDPAYLDEALDRFSQFFIAPLFTDAYVEREKNAVNSEFTSQLKSDQRRLLDVFQQVVNPAHPFSQFSVGNLDTLSSTPDSPVRDDLLAFYQRYYSSNVMSLAVVGPQSLDELSDMVMKRFTEVVDRRVELAPLSQPLFLPGTLPEMLSVRPAAQVRSLSLDFPIPDITPYYREKPLMVLGHVLGNEGEGSLLSWLKEKGWSEGLSAGEGFRYRGGGLFNVTIQLTKEGVVHRDAIIAAVYQAINTLQDQSQWQRLYDELAALSRQHFLFQESGSPTELAMTLARSAQEYPASDILVAPYLMERFDPALISRFLAHIRPDNAVYTLTAPEVEPEKTTLRYDVGYRLARVSDEELQQWQSVGTNPALYLPLPNPFIATQLKLADGKVTAVPQLMSTAPGARLWFRGDDRYELPKGMIKLLIDSPDENDTVEETAMRRLYVAAMRELLNEALYPATLAGLNYRLSTAERGITVDISGFNDKQPELLERILSALMSAEIDEQVFDRVRTELIRRADNADKQQPYRMLFSSLNDVVFTNEWPEARLRDVYATTTLERLSQFRLRFTEAVTVDGLVYGNFGSSERKAILSLIESQLDLVPESPRPLRTIRLPAESLGFSRSSIYSDAAALLYIQTPDIDLTSRAATAMTAQMLDANFYSVLRTEKQLGYIVSSGVYPVINQPGIYFVVQSPSVSTVVLQDEIDSYLSGYLSQQGDTLKAQYDRQRASLISRLAEQPQNLVDQGNRYWRDLRLGFFGFDFNDTMIKQIRALPFETWQSFYADRIANTGSGYRLWLSTEEKDSRKAMKVDQSITNLSTFKDKQKTRDFNY